MADKLVVRERSKMMEIEFLTAITVEQLLHEPADPEEHVFGYRERHLAERICEMAGGAVVTVRDVVGEPIWKPEAPHTRQEALDLARKLLDDVEAFQRCEKRLKEPDTTPEWRRDFEANWCEHHQSALETVLDGVVSRPGFVSCPTCRAPVCFWSETERCSYTDPDECPVCLTEADGSLLPCGHPLCDACLANMKTVPLAVCESAIIADPFKPEHRE